MTSLRSNPAFASVAFATMNAQSVSCPTTAPVHSLGTRDDTAGDGLSDAFETIVSGTNPLLADSDGDGLWDDGELDAGTDPQNPDTDGDGIPDAEEITDLHTSPVNPDTDQDGFDDGDEILAGTDFSWGVITLYNCVGGIPHQTAGPRSGFQSPWEFDPVSGTWLFHQNSNNYALRISGEMIATEIAE